MATTFVDVLLQVDDTVDVAKLAGGKIQTYAAGTTTPLATYQDKNGAVPNTNPVILDSAGMAQIRQTDGVAYKWVVYDTDDNLLFTRDNITVGLSSDQTGDNYRVHLNYIGTPGEGGWMGGHIFADEVVFPVDFEGTLGSVKTNPGSSYSILVKKNDVTVGGFTIDTSGNVTTTTTSHVTVTFEVGDQLDLYGPATAGTAEDFAFVIPGTLA